MLYFILHLAQLLILEVDRDPHNPQERPLHSLQAGSFSKLSELQTNKNETVFWVTA